MYCTLYGSALASRDWLLGLAYALCLYCLYCWYRLPWGYTVFVLGLYVHTVYVVLSYRLCIYYWVYCIILSCRFSDRSGMLFLFCSYYYYYYYYYYYFCHLDFLRYWWMPCRFCQSKFHVYVLCTTIWPIKMILILMHLSLEIVCDAPT